jgi:hypothetical protein
MEAAELYAYYSCAESETNPRLRAIWQRGVLFELGHLQAVVDAFQRIEGRDAREILPQSLPAPIALESQRSFIRKVLAAERGRRAVGLDIVDGAEETAATLAYRAALGAAGAPSRIVADGYAWRPGTELVTEAKTALAPEAPQRSFP